MNHIEQMISLKIQDDLVASGTMDEATAERYAGVCLSRAAGYAAKLATMQVPLYLSVWAKEMETKTGKAYIKAHHNYLPWLQAFCVSRYGEAVEHWPAALTERDVQRAREWKLKGLPASFVA